MNRIIRGISPVTAGLWLTALLWGVNFSVMKSALEELDPFAFTALRFPFAAIVLFSIVRWRGRSLVPPTGKEWLRAGALGLVGHVGYQTMFIVGVDLTLAGNAALLIATTPVWVVLTAVAFRRERFSPVVFIGTTLALAGTAVLIMGGDRGVGVGGGDLRGDLLVVGSAIMWAVFTVFGRRAVKRHGALEVTTWTLWVGTPVLFAIGVPQLMRTDWSSISVGTWAAVVYAGTLAVSVAYFLWYRAIQRIGQSRTSIYANLVPIIALLVAWAWLGEVPRMGQLIGAGVIFLGVGIAWRAPSMKAGDRARRKALREERKTERRGTGSGAA